MLGRIQNRIIFLAVIVVAMMAHTNPVMAWTAVDPPISYDQLDSGFTFNFPYQMTFDGSGNLYVTAGYSMVRKYDSSGLFVSQFGTSLSATTGVAIGVSGQVYEVNNQVNKIDIFDVGGSYVSSIGTGTTGTGNNEFNFPWGIAVDGDGNIYVADSGNNRVQKFDSSWVFQYSITGNSGAFNFPEAVAVDSSNNVYVLDSGNNRVQQFDSTGFFLQTITGNGGAWNYPEGLTVDSMGNIYVADSGNDRIQIFNSAGTFRQQIGTSGSALGQFDYPTGLLIGTDGVLYVGDHTRLQKFIFDRSVATVNITPLTLNQTTSTSPSIGGTVTDALSAITSVEYAVNAGLYSSCVADDGNFDSLNESYTCNVSETLSLGSNTITVRATDSRTNTNSGGSLANYTFDVVDAPTATPTTIPSDTPTLTPTMTPTPTPTDVPVVTDTPTPTPTATETPTGTPEPTATPIPTSIPGNNNETQSAPQLNLFDSWCSSTKAVNSPDIFRIETNSTKAVLHYTPVNGQNNDYIIAYSEKSGQLQHAVSTHQGDWPGELSFIINNLKPKTYYYFKVRGHNGCMPGDWSEEFKVVTQRKGVTKFVRYNKYTVKKNIKVARPTIR